MALENCQISGTRGGIRRGRRFCCSPPTDGGGTKKLATEEGEEKRGENFGVGKKNESSTLT